MSPLYRIFFGEKRGKFWLQTVFNISSVPNKISQDNMAATSSYDVPSVVSIFSQLVITNECKDPDSQN